MFKTLKRNAVLFKDKLALNNLTYSELVNAIETAGRLDSPQFISDIEHTAIITILTAWYQDVPCVLVPANLSDTLRKDLPNIQLPNGFSITLFSSGTTAERHPITQPEKMILANIQNALKAQEITCDDKIYTICSVSHAGGLHPQTLPGLFIGATVYVEPFNPHKFIDKIKNYTISHVAVRQLDILLKSAQWKNMETGILNRVMVGTDYIYDYHLKAFIDKGIDCYSNYGASEAGPNVISHRFKTVEEVDRILQHGHPCGSDVWANLEIQDGILFIKDDIVYKEEGWYSGDKIDIIDGFYYYRGRQ